MTVLSVRSGVEEGTMLSINVLYDIYRVREGFLIERRKESKTDRTVLNFAL